MEEKSSKPQKEKKPNKNRYRKRFALIFALFFVAACILVYPTFMDSICDIEQTAEIGGYTEDIASMGDAEVEEIRERALAYNEKLFRAQMTINPYYLGDDAEDEEYRYILQGKNDSTTMGYIEIPKIKLYLPIVHGTKYEDLKTKIGHLVGTSVPIGGPNSHCILAGHTGLTTADLFTHIDKLVLGDEIYIHVLSEIHIYKVVNIKVIAPGSESGLLYIERDRDLVTLYTCTPYGINDNRLLVTCERDGSLDRSAEEGDTDTLNFKTIMAYVEACLWLLPPFIILIVGIYAVIRREDKNLIVKLDKALSGSSGKKKKANNAEPNDVETENAESISTQLSTEIEEDKK